MERKDGCVESARTVQGRVDDLALRRPRLRRRHGQRPEEARLVEELREPEVRRVLGAAVQLVQRIVHPTCRCCTATQHFVM